MRNFLHTHLQRWAEPDWGQKKGSEAIKQFISFQWAFLIARRGSQEEQKGMNLKFIKSNRWIYLPVCSWNYLLDETLVIMNGFGRLCFRLCHYSSLNSCSYISTLRLQCKFPAQVVVNLLTFNVLGNSGFLHIIGRGKWITEQSGILLSLLQTRREASMQTMEKRTFVNQPQ